MAYNNNITKRIDKISYSILSPKEIMKQSVVKVITPEIYDKYGFPVEGGLMDMRMGVIEPGLACKVCSQSYKNCEGHFGHLELARPILNVLFIDQIYSLLRTTCQECYRVKYPEEKFEEIMAEFKEFKKTNGTEKFLKYHTKFTTNLNKIMTCPHCEAKQEVIKLDKSSVFVFSQGDKKRLLTTEIRFRFENIPQADLYKMADKLESQLLRIKGVAEIRQTGYFEQEIQINVSPKKMQKYYVSLNDVVSSIQNRNIRSTGGSLQSLQKECFQLYLYISISFYL